MPRKSRKRKQYGARRERMSVAWWRPGPIPIAGLSAAVQQADTIVANGSDLNPQPAAVLDFGRKEQITILRVIVKSIATVINLAAPAIVEWWFGWRLQELDDGVNLSGNQPSVLLGTADAKRDDWLWRQAATRNVPAAGVISELVGENGNPVIAYDFRPNRPLPQRHALVFSHAWRLQAGGGIPAATFQGTLDAQVLIGRRL